MITIATPTYNRGYLLSRLYNSLINQSCKDFEWLIIDDGSTDNTLSLVKTWIAEKKINIRYIKQPNGGKHRAINRGVIEAEGSLFFIVDSDDYLTKDAVEWIMQTAVSIENQYDFAGLAGIKIDPEGRKIGGGKNFGTIDTNSIDIRLKYGVTGDLAEIYKTDVLREFPFPEYENERFCPEALIWFRIARKYKLRFCHKSIYVCEYLPDGLTAKIIRIRRDSPKASMTYYSEHFHDNIPIKWKIKAAINFWRFAISTNGSDYRMLTPLSILAWIPGRIMRFIDRKQ